MKKSVDNMDQVYALCKEIMMTIQSMIVVQNKMIAQLDRMLSDKNRVVRLEKVAGTK